MFTVSAIRRTPGAALVALALAGCDDAPESGGRGGGSAGGVAVSPGQPGAPDDVIELEDEAVAQILGEGATELGRALLVADLDNDRQDDLVVWDSAGAHLLYGPLAGAREVAVADATILAAFQGPFAAGDLDGDGTTDLVAPMLGSSRGVDIWSGPLAGPAGLDTAASGIGPFASDALGSRPAAVDLDRDGHDDLVVGLPATQGRGSSVRVYYGPIEGTVSSFDQDLYLSSDDGSYFGAAVDGSADLDGDGVRDLLITAAGSDDDAGGAWLLTEPLYGYPSLYTQLELNADATGEVTGAVLVAGDLDGDAHPDLVFPTSEGLYVMRGPFLEQATLTSADASVDDGGEGHLLAAGDGRFGVGFSDVDGLGDGRVDLYETWETGVRGAPDRTVVARPDPDGLGAASGVGDLDGDGVLDVAFGAPTAPGAGNGGDGRVYVLPLGGP